MIPCNGKYPHRWWMDILCCLGIHWHGRKDGGGMGDANQCHVCYLDTYRDIIIVHREDTNEDGIQTGRAFRPSDRTQ